MEALFQMFAPGRPVVKNPALTDVGKIVVWHIGLRRTTAGAPVIKHLFGDRDMLRIFSLETLQAQPQDGSYAQ
jgi:hypothetical protein